MKTIDNEDYQIIRKLAEQQAKIAENSIQHENIENWKRLNKLEQGRPLLYIWEDQLPWHELNVDDELTLRTKDPFCQNVERKIRRTLYMWKHLRDDRVIEDKFYCPLIIHETDFGFSIQEDIAVTDVENEIVGHSYHSQIQSETDIEKIHAPQVYFDENATNERYQRLEDLLGGMLTIEKRGRAGWNVCPVDDLFTWWGIENAMMDLVLRPELFHKAMERLTQAHLDRIRQYEKLKLFSSGNGNVITGQGGLAFTDELPEYNTNTKAVCPADIWGSAQAQIFVGVSPQMHNEFALRYEKQILERFGLNYYGCCEPLHNKVDILKEIPRLRKISMSPWIDVDDAIVAVEDKFVFSRKPNPSVFATDYWNPNQIRLEVREFFQKTQECVVEVILKDVSTVQHHPERLWEWVHIVREEVEKL